MRNDGKYWLDDPRNVDKLFWGFCAVCALTALADVGGVFYHKQVHFRLEAIWNFHGIYGFVSYWMLVLVAKRLRKLVKREEDFYD